MPLDSDVFRVPLGYNAPQQVYFSSFLSNFDVWFKKQFVLQNSWDKMVLEGTNPDDNFIYGFYDKELVAIKSHHNDRNHY